MYQHERIKKTREALGLNQPEFGAAAGVSKAAVSQWEKGATKPAHAALESLRKKYNISTEYITHGKGAMFLSKQSIGPLPEALIEMVSEWPTLREKQRIYLLEKLAEFLSENHEIRQELLGMRSSEDKRAVVCTSVNPDAPRVVRVSDRRKAQTLYFGSKDFREKGDG